MGKLIRFLRNYKKESIISPLFKFFEACLELIVPLIMAQIIDVGILRQDTGYILSQGAILLLLGVLGLACSLTAQFFAAKAAYGFGTELRRDLFAHIQSLSYTELDRLGTSTLITRLTADINQAQNGVNMFLRLFLRSPFIVIGAVIMAFTINVPMALIFVGAVPVLGLIIYAITAYSLPRYRTVQKELDQVSLATRENLSGVRVIRAFSRQQGEQENFRRLNEELRGTQMKVGRISALLNPLTYIAVNLAIVLIVWQGGYKVYNGDITQGEIIALVNYMTQILTALVALAGLIVTLTKASASSRRVQEIFDVKSSMQPGEELPAASEKGRVEFDHVSMRYHREAEPALQDISFRVEPGQTLGIIGGTGDGKSTLVNLIPRFYDVCDGAVLVDGLDVRQYPMEALRAKIGIVPQKAVLFKGTIRENIRWGAPEASDEEIWRALEIAQAREIVEKKPEGLDTVIEQGGANLSGGQRQRLTIARALVRQPEILILDDSAAALDMATDAALRRAIRENTDSMTTLIVSQRVVAIRDADNILVLDDGQLVGQGTHGELLKTCPVYEEICLSQQQAEDSNDPKDAALRNSQQQSDGSDGRGAQA